MHALHLRMSELDYVVELKVECLNNDRNGTAFIWATATIGGHDAVEEYVVCKICWLRLQNVALGMIPTLKVETPLPLLAVENVATKHANRVLAEIKMEAERVLGSFRQKEYDALKVANIPNGGCLNWVLE
jgi:hypothetical protein